MENDLLNDTISPSPEAPKNGHHSPSHEEPSDSDISDPEQLARKLSTVKLKTFEESDDSELESIGKPKGKKKKQQTKTPVKQVPLVTPEDDDDSFDIPKKGAKEKKRRRANKAEKPAAAPPTIANGEEATTPEPAAIATAAPAAPKGSHLCGRCKETFDSRSKLFKHIEKTGHALPPDAIPIQEDKKGKKKGKRR